MGNMRTKNEIKQLESIMYRTVNKSMLSALSGLKNEIKAEIKKELQESTLEHQDLQTENNESFHEESESSTENTYNGFREFVDAEFGKIRIVNINNEPWFVGKDVALSLGYKDTSDALKKHVDNEDKLTRRFTDSGQSRQMYVINESGLYALIFGSKLESAKRFKHWVTSDVLPTIRSTGFYYVTGVNRDSYMIEDPIERADRWKEEYEEKQQLKQEKEKLEQEKILFLEERIESAPKIAFHDAVSAASAEKENQITVGQLSALLHKEGIFTKGRNRLFEDLRNYGYLCRTIGEWNKPTQKMIDKGYMTYKESYDHRKKVMQFQPFITGKGQIFFANEFLFYKKYQEEKEKEREKYLHKS